MVKRRKGPRRIGAVLMFVGAADFVADVWRWIGDYQQAEQLWKDKGALVERLGWFLDQLWTGPLLIAAGVVLYVGMGFISDWLKKLRGDDDGDGGSPSGSTNSSTQTMTQSGITINNYSGAPPAPSTSAIHAEITDKQKQLAEVKAAKEPPQISVMAVGGKSVTVIVENKGRAFKIGLFTRLKSASMPIDHPDRPNEYFVRNFPSGGSEKTYEIASIDSYGKVCVTAEVNHIIQEFDSQYCRRSVKFEMELKFISKEAEDHFPTVGRWLVKVATDATTKQLKASIYKDKADG
jgi:hypothetical protein